jgi:hypothetical protein
MRSAGADDEHVASATSPTTSAARSRRAGGPPWSRACRRAAWRRGRGAAPRQRGEGAEHEAGERAHADQEAEHRQVERHLVGARDGARGPGEQRAHAGPRDEEPRRAAADREDRALGHPLPHEAPAPRAERDAHGHLALS